MGCVCSEYACGVNGALFIYVERGRKVDEEEMRKVCVCMCSHEGVPPAEGEIGKGRVA